MTEMVLVDHEIPARAAWSATVQRNDVLRIVDLAGNQAVDCLLYDADDHGERYCAAATIVAQRSIFLTAGSALVSNEGRIMMMIESTSCAFHDTIGGACSRESNSLRYGHHTKHQHSCVDNFLDEGSRHGLAKRDLVSNINWFMNVQVGGDGVFGIIDGVSAPGLDVVLRAHTDVLVLISNCPQINNPCNGFDPTPIRVTITRNVPISSGSGSA